ncbi:Glutaredoxin-C6 [Acorus gramineus]|nr:Glutaredoxin-C6 [Acorus gramineus]
MQGVTITRPSRSPAVDPTSMVALTIDGGETPERRIERLISENPVVILSRSSCCMCHVMRRLLSTVGVHPTVVELDEGEIEAIGSGAPLDHVREWGTASQAQPAVFIGGTHVGGLESLMRLHLTGLLVPRLREAGAMWA